MGRPCEGQSAGAGRVVHSQDRGDVIAEACCVVMPGVGVQAWPATLRGVHGDRERFESTYFSQFKGYYTTGDNVRRDGAPPA